MLSESVQLSCRKLATEGADIFSINLINKKVQRSSILDRLTDINCRYIAL